MLGDPEQRAEYDRRLAGAEASTSSASCATGPNPYVVGIASRPSRSAGRSIPPLRNEGWSEEFRWGLDWVSRGSRHIDGPADSGRLHFVEQALYGESLREGPKLPPLTHA